FIRNSIDSATSASSDASRELGLIDRVNGRPSFHLPRLEKKTKTGWPGQKEGKYRDDEERGLESDDDNDEETSRSVPGGKPPDRKARLVCWLLLLLCAGAWGLTFVVFWFSSSDGEYA